MIYSTKDIQVITKYLMNIVIGIVVILISIHAIAPLLGGVFLIESLYFYGSWVVLAVCIKYEAKNILEFKTKKLALTVVNIFELFCLILLLNFIWGTIIWVFLLIVKALGYNQHTKI